MADEMTAEIHVYEPCDCDICRRVGSRWWECLAVQSGARWICSYDCEGIDGTAFPSKRAVANVLVAHPGKVLVYVGA